MSRPLVFGKKDYDALLVSLYAALDEWIAYPFAVPGDWFPDEVENITKEWRTMRLRAVEKIQAILDEWHEEVAGVVND